MVKCPICSGNKGWWEPEQWVSCVKCSGTGEIAVEISQEYIETYIERFPD